MLKKILFTTVAFTMLASAAAHAGTSVSLGINLAPPEERVEYVPPPPQPEMVWAPGYWEWMHGRYVWIAGHYIAPRPGFIWVQDRWEQHDGRWEHARGHWEEDHRPVFPRDVHSGHWGHPY